LVFLLVVSVRVQFAYTYTPLDINKYKNNNNNNINNTYRWDPVRNKTFTMVHGNQAPDLDLNVYFINRWGEVR
jgi:hypothetical protein